MTGLGNRVPLQSTLSGALLSYVPEGTDQDSILLHPTAPRWAQVNRTTRQIVECLQAPGGGPETAAAFLVEEYGIPVETARQDVTRVANDLARKGLMDTEAPRTSGPRIGSMYLMLTERCNLACSHCFGSYPTRKEMALSKVLRLIDELIEGGGTSLVLSGGEPLLYPGLEAVVARIGKRIPVNFCTNGMLLDDRWCSLFARDLNASFQVSLDGPTAEIHDGIRGPNAFAGALRGIRCLQDAGLGDRISLAITIHSKIKDRLPEMTKLAEDLGVKKIRFIPLRKVGRADETWSCTGQGIDVATYEGIFDRYLMNPNVDGGQVEVKCGMSGFSLEPSHEKHEDGHWCPVGRLLVVDPTGDTFPCVLMMQEAFRLGNIHTSSLQAITDGEAMAKVHAIKVSREETLAGCSACNWKNMCQSGCMATALADKGTLMDVDDFCSYRDSSYRRAFDALLASSGRSEPGKP